jgi:hypothetical protein
LTEELDVEAVVEGSVLREGVRVGITAQLIEVSTDQTLWADRYERDLTSVLALQGEIARAIAGEIQVTLTPEEAFRLAARREVGLDPDVSRVGVEWALFLRDVSVTVATGSSTRAPPVDAVPQAEQLWVRDKTAMNPPRTPSRQGITQQQRRPLPRREGPTPSAACAAAALSPLCRAESSLGPYFFSQQHPTGWVSARLSGWELGAGPRMAENLRVKRNN